MNQLHQSAATVNLPHRQKTQVPQTLQYEKRAAVGNNQEQRQ